MISYLDFLECSSCRKPFVPEQVQTICPDCNAPLFAHYDLSRASKEVKRDELNLRPHGMWRWHEFLPVNKFENMISLGEGDTPLIKLNRLNFQLGTSNLFVKDESMNPTGTFKARGLASAISKAKELGIKQVVIPTAGNAGGAMAAYAARAGLEAFIYMPKDTPRANIEESKITGATVIMVDGLINDAARLAGQKAKIEGWFDLSTFKEPYRCEGKKVMGYELAEAFGWTLPDIIIYPTGGGTGLIGMWKAFNELAELGWLKSNQFPRMVSVQAEGCAPIKKAFTSGALFCETWEGAHTIAMGLRVPKSFADKMILQDLRISGGTAVAVSDAEIIKAQKQLASYEGIFACPEGAASLAGFIKLLDTGYVHQDDRVVLFNTGTGLKYLD